MTENRILSIINRKIPVPISNLSEVQLKVFDFGMKKLNYLNTPKNDKVENSNVFINENNVLSFVKPQCPTCYSKDKIRH